MAEEGKGVEAKRKLPISYSEESLKPDEKFRKWLKQEYSIGARIGKGAFSRVYEITSNSDGKMYALKVIKRSRLSEKSAAYLETEIEILRSIDHKHCCKLHDVHYTDYAVYLFLEYLSGGDLLSHIVKQKQYTERDAQHVIRQVSTTLKYLHARGIIHRDLKPDNIIYRAKNSQSDVVLADFGLAKQTDASRFAKSLCGTPLYLSPEMIKGPTYGAECDMWSLGVILYVILSGRPPFYKHNQKDLFRTICKAEFNFPEIDWKDISADAKDLIRKLLVRDTKTRYTAAQVLDHPWIVKDMSQQRALCALSSRTFVNRVKKMIGIQKFYRCVAFLVKMNRFLAIIDMGVLKRAIDLKDIRRESSDANVIANIPTVHDWDDVKRGVKRISLLKMTIKVQKGTKVILNGNSGIEYILKKPCTVLRKKGYWWIVRADEKKYWDESKWFVEYSGKMISVGKAVKAKEEKRSRRSVFDALSRRMNIGDKEEKKDVDGKTMLNDLISGCIRMRGPRHQLMEIVTEKERQGISFWNHVSWFKGQDCSEEDKKDPNSVFVKGAIDIYNAYLRKGCPLPLHHIPENEKGAVGEKIEKKNITKNIFDPLLKSNLDFLRANSMNKLEEVLKILNHFVKKAVEKYSKLRMVEKLHNLIPARLWPALGTKACISSKDSKAFKEETLKKRDKRWMGSRYSKRVFRIHAKSSDLLPETYLSYFHDEDDHDEEAALSDSKRSILLAYSHSSLTDSRTITVEDRRNSTYQ